MMTHHSVMTSSLRIKNFKIDKFGDFSSEIGFNTKMDIFRDVISLIIKQCHLQATEGSLWRTLSVRQPRSASKRSAACKLINSNGRICVAFVVMEHQLCLARVQAFKCWSKTNHQKMYIYIYIYL